MWSDVPNLRHLRVFAAVVACGNLTRAAEAVHLSQPAVSLALARLETRVGTELVSIGPKGATPTEAGRLLESRLERSFEILHAGAAEATRIDQKRRGGGFVRFDQLMTVAQLRSLVAMVEARNFSLAARHLGLSQPSVHRAARDLERISGIELFAATRRGIEPTAAAEILARAAALAHAELAQGFAEISDSLGLDPGEIVVGAMPLVRTKILPDALNGLFRERPRVRVKVISAPYDSLLRRLRYGSIDFLVGALRATLPIDDVVQEPVFSDSLSVVSRAGHPLAERAKVSRHELLEYPWVVAGQETPNSTVFHRLFSPEDVALMPAGTIETSSLVLARGLLSASDRLALLSARQARYEIEQGLLAVVPFSVEVGTRVIGLTSRQGWRPTPTQSLLLDELRRAVG